MDAIGNWDIAVMQHIAQHFRNDGLTAFLSVYTRLGNMGVCWVVIGVALLFFSRTRKWGAFLLAALLFGTCIGEFGIKLLVRRPRPFLEYAEFAALIPEPHGWSFPSGHTLSAFAAATVLWKMRWQAGVLGMFGAVLMGFSRVYLCVHYPSDVIAGALCGIAVGFLTVLIGQKLLQIYHYRKIQQ